ncbi:MAG: hypothetical protein JNM69_10280 [Archangium sp.]|nr:hypothetical protein [Archangium sp.]
MTWHAHRHVERGHGRAAGAGAVTQRGPWALDSLDGMVELEVLDAWNRELLSDARKRLPLRVPEPDTSPEPEPRREEPAAPLEPPASDVPLKRLVLPGLVPTTP